METKTGSNSLFSTDIFGSTPAQEPTSERPATILTKAEQDIYDSLSNPEKAQLTNVIRGIDLTHPNFTSEYGKEARQGIADVNEKALSVTRTKDLGKVGTSMSNLMLQLKGISIPSQSQGIFGRVRSYVEQLNAKLAPAEENVNKAVKIMDAHKNQLAADNVSFDQLYNQNLAYYRALTLYIIAGKLKLEEERKTTLVQLQQKAASTGDMADVEAYKSYSVKLDQFDSLLSEFESSKLLCLQTANAANAAIDFTNALIRQNADMLRQGTIDVARLSQREIIEGDTLEYANQRLIEGLEAVFKIHAEGKATREASREKRAMLEEDLKNELLQLTSRQ